MLALSILVLGAACMARSGELAAGGSDASATASPRSPLYDRQRERLLKERLEAEAQQKKSLDGLTEDELFKELGEALSVERRNAILLKMYREGSLEAADRMEVLAAGIRAGEPGQPNVPSATLLEYFAAEIRFRHTGDRKYRVRALLIVTNPADETFGSSPSRPHTKEIVQQGIVEARSNLVRLLDRDKKNRTEEMAWAMDREIESTRRAIMFLDIWEQAKTAEETFVRAVEQNDYLPLKPCAVDQLIKLDQVSDSTRRRVREALMPHVEAALERVKTRERTAIFDVTAPSEKAGQTPSTVSQGGSTPTDEDFRFICSLYGFWLKHSKEELNAARASRFFGSPCSTHYEEGDRVDDDRCP